MSEDLERLAIVTPCPHCPWNAADGKCLHCGYENVFYKRRWRLTKLPEWLTLSKDGAEAFTKETQ